MICVTDIMDNYVGNGMNNYCQSTITLKYMNKTLSNNPAAVYVKAPPLLFTAPT